MSSGNRPTGCVSIPIEIIPSSNSNFYSRHNPPMQQTRRANYTSSDFTSSPPPRQHHHNHHPTTAYNRLIKNYRPLYQEPSAFYSNHHSNEDILSSNRKPSNTRLESDFIHPPTSLRRSFDVLNDSHVPTNHPHQGTLHNSHDRSHSPASQRGESPTRPPPPQGSSQQQQQQESDFKISKDLPSQSNDQQVPSTDTIIRDPNSIALEKLGQIKQNLTDLHQQVDAFTGSTRDDRQYKELDEQAVKLMIRCDELIDVSADIKEKRKEMIQNVQTIVAKLESKVPLELNSNETEHALVIYDSSIAIPEQST